MRLVDEGRETATVKDLCKAYGISEASYYRWKSPTPAGASQEPKKLHWRGLSEKEERGVLEALTSERFIDVALSAVVATLLDEGKYLCSARTMYRILKKNASTKERRDQRRHPEYVKPELLATGPNQVWSWDITKLRTGRKWEYLHLYVIMDIYSRKVVGWTVANCESAELAEKLIGDTIYQYKIPDGQLTLHADRGAAMKSKAVSQLLADLGVEKTHSRPHVSDDNPYSESQFKTLKYHSTFPKTFPNLDEAKLFLEGWFRWYNTQHKHSGIHMLCPQDVHDGKAQEILDKRQAVLDKVYQKHPERFPSGCPKLPKLSGKVWINKPKAS